MGDISQPQRIIIRNAQQDESKSPSFVTKRDRIAKQYHIIRSWKPRSDVWPLIVGRGILIGTTVITSLYLNHRFRAKMKIRDYGILPTVLGLAVSPAAVTAVVHTELVMNKLLLLEIPCPLCIESMSAFMQTCSGVFLPLILVPLANFSVTVGSGVYNVPHITDIRGIFRRTLSIYQPIFPKIAMIFTFHALLAGFIAYSEIKSYLRMLDMQYLMEEEKEQKLKNNIL
ncbi:PREDICTED: uncharacterized protein LOC108762491 [Trachymyrmex cornetzi]|uniref:uncharacterized protein LOC108762491 n=1 Tax=Trachymyrmex cornetzi TaxID=471704 RepID=UPI00084F2DB5|nr:PREDICTED: uncharacterized protein LOC108762491 [Trachymyrmex cornetzi]